MCGICGYVNLEQQPIQQWETIKEMTEILTHRGPDEDGFYVKDNIALGMRRLKIIDLKIGRQPIHNEDKSIWVILNGEIYNYQDLRVNLIEKGHSFYTNSDTEVLVHLYEEFGKECVKFLNGMFSFCIYDSDSRELFFARDRLGEKPFFYYRDGKIFVFASELKSLSKHPGVKKVLDPLAFNKYLLYGYIPAPASILKNINKLEAGNTLSLSTDRKKDIEIHNYWRQSFKPKTENSEEVIIEDIRNRLRSSVKSRLISDMPVGVLLSGGIDSSLVVAMMSEFLPPQNIKTFSIGFREKKFDESNYARIVASKFKTDHKEKILSANDALEALPEIFKYMDEPMSDPSIVPTYLVNKFASQYVKVALTGDGGDELFGGYPKYAVAKALKIYEFLPQILRSPANSLAKSFFNRINNSKASRFFEVLDYPEFMHNQLWVSNFLPPQISNLLSKEFCPSFSEDLLFEDVRKSISVFDGTDNIDQAFFLDTIMNLQNLYLVKADRASMMNSIEVRAPFLNHELVEYASTLGADLKLKMFKTKYLLKKLASQYIPKKVIYRKKMGFGMPLAEWLRSELKEKVEALKQMSDIFNSSYIKEIVDEHFSGSKDNSGKIWPLVVFNEWFSRWMK